MVIKNQKTSLKENTKAKTKKKTQDYHVKCDKKYLKFFKTGKRKDAIKVAMTHDLKEKWVTLNRSLLEPRKGYFDSFPLNIFDAFLIEEGVILFYFVKKPLAIGAALFDQTNPEILLWRSANPLYQAEKNHIPHKITKTKRNIKIYLHEGPKQQAITFSLDYLLGKLKKNLHQSLKKNAIVYRNEENPIIQPQLTHQWECSATFNAAAIYLNGKVHFIYRAIGHAGMSVLGYAASKDGIHIDERLPDPVYVPKEPFEFRQDHDVSIELDYDSGGGGWGGCEDPRLTKVDDTIFMTYTAFNGVELPGVALTAIKVKDFLNKKWRWRKPILISPRGRINKNWVIFPEKIRNKYAILHSISPQIFVDYFENLLDKNICINSYYGPSRRNNFWDNHLRGVGPPPIKTKEGWLILYHAMDERDPNKYKLGVMILDYRDPTYILYRATQPILEPVAYYENHGYKSGVIYSCGAVVIDDQLFVYYGGADTVTCVATANLTQFLERLKNSQLAQSKCVISKLR